LGGSLALPGPRRLGGSLALPGPRRLGGSLALPSRPRVYLGAGWRAKKNGVATAMAFRRLAERVPGVRGVVFAEEPEAEAAAYARWGVEGVAVRAVCGQQRLWAAVAGYGVALHLDYRRTIGRFAGECAALGVPCVATAGATMQRACFPGLMVEPWDVEGAAALAARLLADGVFRQRAVGAAARAIERYALEPMARRFRAALGRLEVSP
ncbi:MAG: hypothetical protein ACOC8D_01815, partial [bacterium]